MRHTLNASFKLMLASILLSAAVSCDSVERGSNAQNETVRKAPEQAKSAPSEEEFEQDDAVAETNMPSVLDETSNETEPSSEVASMDRHDSGEQNDEPKGEGALAETEANVTEIASDPSEATAETESANISEPHYLVWLPTTKGPVVIGMQVWIGDQTLQEAHETQIDSLFSELKETPENTIDWEQLFDFVAADADRFGQSSARLGNQRKNLIKRYDTNTNKKVERDELAEFLFRDSRFASEFRVFGSDAYRWINRSDSPLFRAIDEDRNRKLSGQEIEGSSSNLLHAFDINSDGCIDLAEFRTEFKDVDNAWSFRRSHRQGEVAMDLSGFVNWSNLSFAIGGMFGPVDFLREKDLASWIDEDSDGFVTEKEAEILLEVEPAATLVLNLDSNPEGSASPSSIPISNHWVLNADQTDAHLEPVAGGITWIANQSLRIGATLHEDARRTDAIPKEVFDQLDANDDGGLDENEIPDAAAERISLEQMDLDGDGKLSMDEINQLRRKPESIWSYQVRCRAAEHPHGVFAWLDTNHDHFLTSREIAEAPKRLIQLRGARVSLRPQDIPDTILVQIARGEPNQDTSRLEIRRAMRSNENGMPEWARHMDGNRDGDISQHEFPGPIELFQRLDQNADDFIDAGEILSGTDEFSQ